MPKRIDVFPSKDASKKSRNLNFLQSNLVCKISSKHQNEFHSEANESPTTTESDRYLIKNWGLPDQIVRYYRDKGIDRFFPWQVEALEQPQVLENYKNLVYSAPTSAGKTMVSDILLYKNILERKKKAIVILPFVSITVEKVETLKKMMRRIGVKIDKFAGNINPKGGFSRVDVAVCTIEKANNMVNRLIEDGNLSDVGLVIVDELHMLGDSSRGYLLELLLTKILYHSKQMTNTENLVQIVGMSATIPNLPDIARWLDAELFVTDYRPVPLYERIVQVIGKETLAPVFEYDKDNSTSDFKSLSSIDTRELGINHDEAPLIYSAIETMIEGYSALMFCPTKVLCEKYSREIAFNIYEFGARKKPQTPRVKEIGEKIVEIAKQNTEKIIKLMDSLKKSSAGLDPQLEESIRFGVAFHHAGMSTDERSAVEEAFRNGVVKILCSTTTLSAGVNLPARRVLISSPFNYSDQLLNVITYRQMIGRAGRKGIDELGEAYTFVRSKDFEQAQFLVRSNIKPIQSCLLRLQVSSSNSEDSNSNSSLDCLTIVMSESLKKAIIEIISNGTAINRNDIIDYCKCTFFNESFRSRFTEEEQRTGSHFESAIDQVFDYLSSNQLIYFNNDPDADSVQARVYVSNLGKAIVASGILPDDGQFIQKELDRARNNLSLVNDLHLVYQVTPTYISNQLDSIDWRYYLDLWQKLSPEDKMICEKIGVTPGFLVSRCNSTLNLSNPCQLERYQIHKRFYASLALHDLIQEIPLVEVARKYRLVKGQIQSLQQQAATFAGMLATFCNKLGWFSMELLIDQFQPRLAFGVQRELIDLMRITFLPSIVARSLYKHYPTLKVMVYEKAEDIERSIVQGIAFDNNENMDPKSKLIFVPALEQHFTISDFAVKVLEEARDIIQTEIGQKLVFEPQESSNLITSETVASNTIISPIKVKRTDVNTVADCFNHVSSSTPVEVNRTKVIKNVKKEDLTNFEVLFDDDLEFSFGATPNKLSRLDLSLTSTPSNNRILKKEKSSKKLNFNRINNDEDHSKEQQTIVMDKEPIFLPLNENKITQESTTSGIVADDDCNDLLNNSLDNLTWSDLLSKVTNPTKDVCLSKTAASTLSNSLCDSALNSSQQHSDKLFDQLTTNDFNIPPRVDRLLSSEDSGVPNSHTDCFQSSSFSFDDSENYTAIFNDILDKQDSSIFKVIPNKSLSPSSSSFEFEDFSQEELDQIINQSSTNAPNINHTQLHGIGDENSYSSLDFFDKFKNRGFTNLPDCFKNTEVLLDSLSLINVNTEEILNELILFIDHDSLDLIVHFIVKPFTMKPMTIVQKPNNRNSIVKFLESKPSNGLIIQEGNPIELIEMFITLFGANIVYRIDTKDIFEQFIERFRRILSKIDPIFEDFRNSPFSVRSDSNIDIKMIRIITYDIKLCLHLFKKAFRLPLIGLIRKIEWYDLTVSVWLLDPEACHFNINNSTIQDLIELSLVHSLDQEFINKIRIYNLSIGSSSNSLNRKKSRMNKQIIEDSPQIGMIKTIMLAHLMKLFGIKLIKHNLYRSYRMIEIPARLSFAAMEMRGIHINDVMLQFEHKRIRRFRNFIAKQIFKLVGKKFNLNSSDQVAQVLFQDQGLLPNYFNVTKTMSSSKVVQQKCIHPNKLFSTNKLALFKLQEACGTKTRLPTLIMEWRRLNCSLEDRIFKIRQALKDNGFVYCQIEEWSSTGRIAMHNPNFINIDKDYEISSISTEIGKHLMNVEDSDDDDNNLDLEKIFDKNILSPTKISAIMRPVRIRLRKMIVARPGYCLVSADYCQLELRILAHFSKDTELLATLNDSLEDVFKSIASSWQNVSPDNVSYEGRQQAKQICYAIIYGSGDRSLAEKLAVTIEEARDFRNSFLQKYSRIQDFIEKTIQNCQENSFIEMISHRRRPLPHIHSENSKMVAKAQRQAINSVIQGSAADFIKLAMIAVDTAIYKSSIDASLILQMHDELMYEVRNCNGCEDDPLKNFGPLKFAKLLKTQMEGVSKYLKVILPVKVKTGTCWGELEEIIDI